MALAGCGARRLDTVDWAVPNGVTRLGRDAPAFNGNPFRD
jgi:hypothetical protein